MDPSSSSSSNKRKRGLDSYDEPCYKKPKYDVFVNYASEDLGKRFVSHLKGALGREGFTICDHTMLPLGQDESSELLKAIEDSEIYLLVFSDKYASSVKCLEEFALIMETYPKFKHRKVLPVFFNVEPTDVKNQQGPFLDAFKDHETKVDPNKVQMWRQALREAGHLSGLPFQNGDEAEFVQKILKDIRNMQNPQQLCNVNHLVGIESRAQDIISALRLGEQTFTIVAVLGFSGTGKTASVKAVYDMIAPEFDASCFIQNIRSYTNREADLQKDVISYLTGNDTFIARHNDGAARIKKLMSSRKALLVLDDVYDSDQLEALVTDSASFHRRSRIIVTTINKQSLSCLHSYIPYNIRLLDDSESFQLFTGLTFGEQDTIEMNFVDEIVWRAGGIPLVLKVWGRHFRDNERKLWPSMLETLKRIPHEDTQKKLRTIYDLLPKRAQNLFLDIACFFDGMDKDTIVKVLQEEDFFPDFEIQNLVHKFLVIDSSWIILHDVIRKMGQEVVRQEDEDEPGKRTRLMGYRDVVRVLGDCSGTDSVRSINLYSFEKVERVTVQLEAFRKMGNLRFINLADNHKLQWSSSSNDDMSACFSFKHLKYLDWQYFPCKSLDNIDMGNVVVIILRKSKLEKLWEGVKSFKKLKTLVVSSSSLTKTGNFIGLENLEELRLGECENLEELDSSIGCLQKLVELHLSHCTRLEELDSSIGCLKKLVSLQLNHCKRLKRLPWEMIGKLTSLQYLYLSNCPNILEISHEIGSLISLEYLNLSGNRFNNLPNSLGQLHQLNHLNLSENRFSSLPDSLFQLHQLTRLDLLKCTNLKSIPDLPPSIKVLEATDCINLVNLPSNCSELQFLTYLQLDDCSKLGSEGFTQVTGLRNLQELYMRNCNVSQVSSRIGNLVSLVILNLSENTFSSLPESFSNLLKLKTLYINSCSKLQLLPPLPSQLTDIDARYCWSLDVMPFDLRQKAYTFRSKVFKELLTSTEGFHISLSREESHEWCTYRNTGNNVFSFEAPIRFDSKICGLILCATANYRTFSTIHNKTKEKSHRMEIENHKDCTRVVFHPLNGKTVVVEAGDTVELQFDDADFMSCGLRLIYEDDVVDSGLVLKFGAETTFILPSVMSITQSSDNEDCFFPIPDDECLSLFPLSSEIMTGNSITELNDEDLCSFTIQNDEECTYYDFFPMVS